MYEDNVAVNLLYNLAIEDIRQGRVKPADKIQQIKELKAANNKLKVRFIDLLYCFPSISFQQMNTFTILYIIYYNIVILFHLYY